MDGVDRKVPLIGLADCGEINEDTFERFRDYGLKLAEMIGDAVEEDEDEEVKAHCRAMKKRFHDLCVGIEEMMDDNSFLVKNEPRQ